MRTFAQILDDFSAAQARRTTNRAKLREMFSRLWLDSSPVVGDATARNALFSVLTGDEKVWNKATNALERYDSVAQAWLVTRRRAGLIGTEAPNPAVQLYLGYTKAAASPPSVTDWGVDDSIGSIASSVYYSPIANGVVDTNVPWRYLCAAIQKTGSAHVNANSVRGMDGTGGFYVIEFMYDAQKFEFLMTCHGPTGSSWRILVDNEWVGGPTGSGETLQAGTANGITHRILVDCGSRSNRLIRLELSSDITFKGISIQPDATMWRPPAPAGPLVMGVGDSFIAGSNGTSPPANFLNVLGKMMGWRNTWSDGEGGTGYLTAGSGATFATRIEIDVIPRTPDLVIVEGGRNDLGTYSASAIATAAGTLFSRLRTALPTAKLICVAPYKITDNPDQFTIDTRDAVRTAVQGLADLFIDPVVATAAGANTKGWFTAGNLANYLYSDLVHPTVAGSKYIGFRTASAIVAAMPF